MKVKTPPIKSQGIKTKLVPWIKKLIPDEFDGKWIEPFMGTGVVGFNLAPRQALLADTNPHIINFYQAIADGIITPAIVKKYLKKEGQKLQEVGESHYYYIRERFNESYAPLDFLFLSRAGFNGMMRFNQKGKFNIPFCRKPNRFSQSYVTKIVNQVDFVAKLLLIKDFTFTCQGFSETIKMAKSTDIIYCDPPYIGRHVDYYNSWDSSHEEMLFEMLSECHSNFMLSTWHHNDFRKNEYIDLYWKKFNMLTRDHFYHVGAKEKNRRPMVEAIITNLDTSLYATSVRPKARQLQLLEENPHYQ